MKKFPTFLKIKSSNKPIEELSKNLQEHYIETILKPRIREAICDFIIANSLQANYFNFYEHVSEQITLQTVQIVVGSLQKELESIGWKTKLAYGNTGMFIYSTNDPPITYVAEEDIIS